MRLQFTQLQRGTSTMQDIFGNEFTAKEVANGRVDIYLNGEYYTRCTAVRWADCLASEVDGVISELPYIQ